MTESDVKMVKKPILIIVMGTSGSGKSTFGAALASALDVPFIDGDDLHPKANVDKMSRGEPLNDEDRLPWLLSIRHKALAVCHCEAEHHTDNELGPEHEKRRIRQLAEINETSQQQQRDRDTNADEIIAQAAEWKKGDLSSDRQPRAATNPQREACVIACSALRKTYRHLLRFGLDVADEHHDESDEDRSLDVHHVYLHVAPDELLRRMHERKGHFMKEGMLKSQLRTLEDPTGEPRTLVLEQAPTDILLQKAKQYFGPLLTGVTL